VLVGGEGLFVFLDGEELVALRECLGDFQRAGGLVVGGLRSLGHYTGSDGDEQRRRGDPQPRPSR